MWTSIIGPVRGLFISTYACPVGEFGDRYVGYYKLSRHRPVCFCDGGALLNGVTSQDFSSPEAALHQAVLAAREPLTRLGDPQAPRPSDPLGLPHIAPEATCCSPGA
jgi:hypothetical protein